MKHNMTLAVTRWHIENEIDDVETLRQFRKSNPRYSLQRNRIINLPKDHLLSVKDTPMRIVRGMLRSIKKTNPDDKFKAIKGVENEIIIGWDVAAQNGNGKQIPASQ